MIIILNIFSYIFFIGLLFYFIGYGRIKDKLLMYKYKSFWTDYNLIEFGDWLFKSSIIIFGLVLQKEIWWMHFFTLLTSSLLIWTSMKKSLPTLIVFNTLWILISLTIILRNIL
jgi:hypothetical protein